MLLRNLQGVTFIGTQCIYYTNSVNQHWLETKRGDFQIYLFGLLINFINRPNVVLILFIYIIHLCNDFLSVWISDNLTVCEKKTINDAKGRGTCGYEMKMKNGKMKY